MSRIGELDKVLTGNFLLRFQGLAQGGASSAASALSGGGQDAALFDGLRLGATVFSNAIQNLNTVIGVVNAAEDTLKGLLEVTDELISLASRASKAGTGDAQRSKLDVEFQSLGNKFRKIVEESTFSDQEYLTKEGLVAIFSGVGLDEQTSSSIADLFAQFVFPEEDDALASERSKGSRPVRVPSSSFHSQASDTTYSVNKVTNYALGGSAEVATGYNIFSDTDSIMNANSGYTSDFIQSVDGSIRTVKSALLTASVTLRAVNETTGYSVVESSQDFLGFNGSLRKQLFLVDTNGNVAHQITNNASATLTFGGVDLSSTSLTAAWAQYDSATDTSVVYKSTNVGGLGTTPADDTFTAVDSQALAGGLYQTNVKLSDDGNYIAYFNGTVAATRVVRFRDSANTLDSFITADTKMTDFDFINNGVLAVVRSGTGVSAADVRSYRYGTSEYGETLADEYDNLFYLDAAQTSYSYGINKISNVAANAGAISRVNSVYYKDSAPDTLYLAPTQGGTATTAAITATSYVLSVNQNTGYSLVLSTANPLGFNAGGFAQVFLANTSGSLVHQYTANTGAGFTGITSADLSDDHLTIAFSDIRGANSNLTKVTATSVGQNPATQTNATLTTGTAGQFTYVSVSDNGSYVAARDVTNGKAKFYNSSNTVDSFLDGRTDVQAVGFLDSNKLAVVHTSGSTQNVEGYTYNGGSFASTTLLTGITIGSFAALEDTYSGTYGYFAYNDSTTKDLYIYNSAGTRVTTYDLAASDSISSLSLSYDTNSSVSLGVFGSLQSFNSDADNELYRLSYGQSGSVTGGIATYHAPSSKIVSLINAATQSVTTSKTFASTDTINDVSIALNSARSYEGGIRGSLSGYSGDTDIEFYRMNSNSRSSTGRRFARLSAEFENIFDEENGIRSRPNAIRVLSDLKALRGQIEDNIDALGNAREVVAENVELIRQTGLAFLQASDTVRSDSDAENIARQVREIVRDNATTALTQAENLESIVVAALAIEGL